VRSNRSEGSKPLPLTTWPVDIVFLSADLGTAHQHRSRLAQHSGPRSPSDRFCFLAITTTTVAPRPIATVAQLNPTAPVSAYLKSGRLLKVIAKSRHDGVCGRRALGGATALDVAGAPRRVAGWMLDGSTKGFGICSRSPCFCWLRGLDMLNATRCPSGTGSIFDESAGQLGFDSPTASGENSAPWSPRLERPGSDVFRFWPMVLTQVLTQSWSGAFGRRSACLTSGPTYIG
jgi:hypothetical protein